MAFPTGNERLQCGSLCLSICKISKPSCPSLFSYFVSRQKFENMMFVKYVSKCFITEKKKKKKEANENIAIRNLYEI